MKRLLAVALALAVGSFLFANGQGEKGGSSAALKDGTYFATYTTADSHGWQPFMRMSVRGGKIASVDFDYVSPDGRELKTRNSQYDATMLKFAGTNPVMAYPELEKRIVAAQSARIDVVSGATDSSETAMVLAARLLAKARTGDTSDLVLPMTGVYVAEDKPDDRGGWIGHLEVTFGDQGKPTKVSYDEVKKGNGKITAYKSQDKAYAKNYKAGSGIVQSVVYARLSDELMAAGTLSTVDAVSGATETSGRFNALVENVIAERASVSPATIRALLK